MNKKIKKILACPECKADLYKQGKLICKKCKKTYLIKEGIPIFLKKTLKNEEISIDSFKSKLIKNQLLLQIRDIIGPPDPSYVIKKENRIKKRLFHNIKNKLILNIGSSSKKIYPNTINLDIGNFPNVDVVADGKKLPFKNNVFDVILIESVLEHIDEPELIIKEAYRVLKKKGKIFITIPFVFVFHGSPNDFNRLTIYGLKRRLELEGFKNIKTGISCGPGSTFNQILRYYLALLFSFNNEFLFSLFLNIFGWLTFPLKYTDILLNKYKKAHLIANIVYAIGEK